MIKTILFLLHIACDYGTEVQEHGVFEKAVDYIVEKMNIFDDEAEDKRLYLFEVE